ncbi:hypothetical protein B0H16DRAFT_1720977 [Mycena metata]|uniref:Uncharacterized protein n=1 Tax=Mycena metata TaxID=1033252 RepID=A0AAD7NFT0_9AGAR|nr:hypothetical protein B0H16DRAFT_1720977 [Mycena metata]
MSVFPGVFSSIEEFFDEADWNQLEELSSATETKVLDPALSSSSDDYRFPRIRTERLRVVANEPFPRRTLRDMCPPKGAFMYRPRIYDRRRHTADSKDPGWTHFRYSEDWYDTSPDGPQQELEDTYGLVVLIPAMFVPYKPYPCRGDMVLSHPGGAGTYYFWWNPLRMMDDPEVGFLHRFEGVYDSLEHFVREADWNRLTDVPSVPLKSESDDE